MHARDVQRAPWRVINDNEDTEREKAFCKINNVVINKVVLQFVTHQQTNFLNYKNALSLVGT